MAVGDGALAGIGGDDRRRHELGERREPLAGLGIMHALTGPQQRMLCCEQHLDGFFDGLGIGRAAQHRHRRVVELALVYSASKTSLGTSTSTGPPLPLRMA